METLGELRRSGAYRALSPPLAPLDFSSNDYLGMANDAQVREGMREYLRGDAPLGATGSRLLRGHGEAHASCETHLAAAFGAESALLFGSGYLANLGVLGALADEGTEFFSDALL